MYYQIADMQAIPSLCEEAVGLVALEGMCSGLVRSIIQQNNRSQNQAISAKRLCVRLL